MRGCAVFLFARRLGVCALLTAAIAGCTPPAPPPAPASPPSPRPMAAIAPSPPKPPGGVKAPRPDAFRQVSIVLYQPDAVLKARLGDAAPLAGYIRRIDRGLTAELDQVPAIPGFQAALVVALKPAGESHAWLVSQARLPHNLRDALTKAAQAVPPLHPLGGPVAFAIIFNGFGGGGKPVVDAAHPIPIPPEWRNQVAPSPLPQGPAPASLSQ